LRQMLVLCYCDLSLQLYVSHSLRCTLSYIRQSTTYVFLAAHPPVEAYAVEGCRARAWRRAAVPVAVTSHRAAVPVVVASHWTAAATTEAGYRPQELDTTGKQRKRKKSIGRSRAVVCSHLGMDRREAYADG
jgi:hypothetical protein